MQARPAVGQAWAQEAQSRSTRRKDFFGGVRSGSVRKILPEMMRGIGYREFLFADRGYFGEEAV